MGDLSRRQGRAERRPERRVVHAGLCVVPIPQGPEAGEAEGVLAVGPHAAPEPVPRLALATGLAQALSLSRFACGAA